MIKITLYVKIGSDFEFVRQETVFEFEEYGYTRKEYKRNNNLLIYWIPKAWTNPYFVYGIVNEEMKWTTRDEDTGWRDSYEPIHLEKIYDDTLKQNAVGK